MAASKAQRAATAERRSQAIRMRMAGSGYQAIADDLGYASAGAAYTDITRALEASLTEQRRTAEMYREEELLRLDEIWARTWQVMEREHVTVSQGKVIYYEDGPLLDDAPVLQAVDRLLKIQERRARYLGLDVPQRHEVTLDEIDAQIRDLTAELGVAGDAEVGETPGVASIEADQG